MGAGASEASRRGALARLIAPLPLQQFFAEYYEQRHYRGSEPVAEIADLLDIDRIDEIISDSELPRTSLTMAFAGHAVPPGEYTFGNGNINRGAVLDLFRQGRTIVLPQLHYADGKLFAFCLALEREFGARVQTNIYLTPRESSGFGIHYDDHDVIVLQVSGRKKWEIYGRGAHLPYRGEKFDRRRDSPGDLIEEFVLEPGQSLYVPRGLMHRAQTVSEEPSLHITVGILVQTWADLLLEAVGEASLRTPALRKSLPPSLFLDEGETARHGQHFAGLLAEVCRQADFDAVRDMFADNFVRGQGPRVRGGLNLLGGGIRPGGVFRFRDDMLFRFDEAEDGAQLTVAGSRIALDRDIADALRRVSARTEFSLDELGVADNDRLRDAVGQLVAYGLLEACGSRGRQNAGS